MKKTVVLSWYQNLLSRAVAEAANDKEMDKPKSFLGKERRFYDQKPNDRREVRVEDTTE